MTEIKDKTVQVFLNELASKAATPGGGSAAAVMGATSAALVSMVCNLTMGKPAYAEVEADMQALLDKSEALREKLIRMIEADVDVFERVMACYRLPKASEQEKADRSEKIQAVLKEAARVPLECARACSQVIQLSREAAEKGNTHVISDAGVAVMGGYAALKSAALNVYINVGGIRDKEFTNSVTADLEKILQGADVATEEIYQQVKCRL